MKRETFWEWYQKNRPEEAEKLFDCFGLQDVNYATNVCDTCDVRSDCYSETMSKYENMN